jgi:hypothetical protein
LRTRSPNTTRPVRTSVRTVVNPVRRFRRKRRPLPFRVLTYRMPPHKKYAVTPCYRVSALFRYAGVRAEEAPVKTRVPPARSKSLAQPMHNSVTGRALRRSVAIGRRHEAQEPYLPAATRASARSTSLRRASACARRAAVRSRSNAIVAPSGSCSSSPLVSIEAATIPSNSAASARRRFSICPRSNSSTRLAAHASVTASQ